MMESNFAMVQKSLSVYDKFMTVYIICRIKLFMLIITIKNSYQNHIGKIFHMSIDICAAVNIEEI
jgi:hypothetical protein